MQISSRYIFLLILLANILLACILYSFITPCFLSDDDTSMMLRAAGVLVLNHPTANILFSNIVIGFGLKSLYELCHSVPWYGVYYASVLILSNSVLCYVLIKITGFENAFVFYFIYLLLAGIYLMLEWQFTMLSYIAFIAGIAAFYFYPLYEKKGRTKPSTILRAMGLLLLIISFLIRYLSFVSSFLLLIPILIIHVYQNKTYRLLLQLIIVVAVAFTFNLFSIHLQDKLFNNYYSFNGLQGSAREYHTNELNSGNLKAIALANWSANDNRALKSWFFFDENVFNKDKFKAYLSARGTVNLNINITTILKKHYDFILRHRVSFFSIVVFIIAIIFSFNIGYIQLAVISMIFGWLYFILSATTVIYKYPVFRVQFPFLLLTCFICLFHLAAMHIKIRRRNLLFMAIPSIIIFFFISKEIINSDYNNKQTNEGLKDVLTKTKSSPFVIDWAGALSLESISPFFNPDEYKNFRVFGLGCFEQSEENKIYLKDMGFSSLKEAIYYRHIPLLIDSSASDNDISILKTFGQEHYGLNISVDTLFRNNKLIAVAVK